MPHACTAALDAPGKNSYICRRSARPPGVDAAGRRTNHATLRFSVTILGSSSAKPTPDRHTSAQGRNGHDQYYLVDAGEGTQQQLIRRGINPLKLRAVFISHLHGDHLFGLFPLFSTLGLYGRRTELPVYAPAPFGEMLACHLRYFDPELPYRITWPEVRTTDHALLFDNRPLDARTLPPRPPAPTARPPLRPTSPPPTIPRPPLPRYGLSIAQIAAAKRGEDVELESGERIPNAELTYLPYQPRSYAYLSDTNFSAKAAGLCRGVELMYHEATYAAAEQKLARERGHSTTLDAARAALGAGARRLVIGHFSTRYKQLDELVAEARTLFPETFAAREGETFTIEKHR